MQPQESRAARVVIVEARPGAARTHALAELAREGAGEGCWLVSADAEREGTMAGLDEWMRGLLPRLEREAFDLVVRHDAELTALLPELRVRIKPRYMTLTDSSNPAERVRNYPRDRADRLPQGLVDLLDEWHTRTGGGSWTVACDHFDRRGALAGRFFQTLLRRRGEKLALRLLVGVNPGAGDAVAGEFAPFAAVERVRLDLPGDPDETMRPEEAARRAEAMEWIGASEAWTQMSGHEVIRYWTHAAAPTGRQNGTDGCSPCWRTWDTTATGCATCPSCVARSIDSMRPPAPFAA